MTAIAIPSGGLTSPGSPTVVAPPPVGDGPRPWKWTREEYGKLAELGFFRDCRVELIYGEIIEMGKQSWPHALCVSLVAEALRKLFSGIGWVSEQSPHPTADSAPEPDVRAIRGTPRDYTDHPTSALLAVEVADSSLFLDTTTKAQLYAEAGIADYWVVDLNGRQLHVFRDPVPLPTGLGATAYRTHLTLAATKTVAPLAVPNTAIRVADLLP